jgi:hypothetical protein
MIRYIYSFLIFSLLPFALAAQKTDHPEKKWHNQSRELRYRPDGEDFIITNGNKRFTRALYGTNTAFRVEAGDLPEFALYMPGMGGNMQFALINGSAAKWLNKAENIIARYRAGTMIYEISDPMLGNGKLYLQLLAMNDAEGFIVKLSGYHCPANLKLLTVFGGASNQKFSRSGDIGADPESSFYLKPENCKTNRFEITKNKFALVYGNAEPSKARKLIGTFSEMAEIKIADASHLANPKELILSTADKCPVLMSLLPVSGNSCNFIAIQNPENRSYIEYPSISGLFDNAENARKELTGRVKIVTPDPYINTFGGALSVAADAIWDGTSYQHGAVAWRMPLNGWRGAYVGDPLGWHDRAVTHFREYAKAQYSKPDSGPSVPDAEKNLARQQETEGISLFTSGYISRNPGKLSKPHHYDMNLVFIDQLLTHFMWTGDTAFIKEMWPVLTRHLAWEKRNFDSNGDGLYDAYCCIWASDALQYSGGGVTHSSAYNYKANKLAGELAARIGEDPKPYINEAHKILKAIQTNLWMKSNGWYAEYKDLLGAKQVHPSAGLWTVYHTFDSEVPDPFEAYQTLRYVDTQIPHIPIIADGIDSGFYMLSTTNWMPYTWSINNVVTAEMYHTALAYWQGGNSKEAFHLWKSNVLESMYLGSSPGNFSQISFYDAFRGELYRDFADPIGIAARSLVEGLFGIKPNALSGELSINPGFPESWDHASLHIPNIEFSYQRNNDKEYFTIIPKFTKHFSLNFQTIARKDGIKSVTINGEKILWNSVENAIGNPKIALVYQPADTFKIEIEWEGSVPAKASYSPNVRYTDSFTINTGFAEIQEVKDPQGILRNTKTGNYQLNSQLTGVTGHKTFFIKMDQNQISWWQPINLEIGNPPEKTHFETKSADPSNATGSYKTFNLNNLYNDKVTHIFKNKYLTPRPSGPTLQLPVQGIGNWCYPMATAEINDSGLRKAAGKEGVLKLPQGIPFKIPVKTENKNILFTSLWDNYPDSIEIPLKGNARHAWFLMAGTTNPMQSRITNGIIKIEYLDGTSCVLKLINPETWWPIEQDYYVDGFAFALNAPKPWRVHLKTGLITNNFCDYQTIKGYSTTAIDGGAATVLDMPVDPSKKLKRLVVKTIANDVIIGLMGLTLEMTK